MIRAKFQIYEDRLGAHYVLLKARLAGVWLALQVSPRIGLVFLSEFNLKRLHLVGRAGFHA